MTYDSDRGKVVLFGGTDTHTPMSDTWEWDGTTWTQQFPSKAPAAANHHRMVYDAARGRVVLFGGRGANGSYLAETWEWDGINWVQRHPGSHPPSLSDPGMVYDPTSGRTIVFGGCAGVARADTWEYGPTNPGTYTTTGAGCLGTAGVPQISTLPNTWPWIGSFFSVSVDNIPDPSAAVMTLGFSNTTWSGVPLPAGLGVLGMTNCTLYSSIDLVFPLTPATSSSGTWNLDIANDPGFVGATFFNQAFVLDPAANPLGLTASNAGGGMVGGK